MLSWQNQFSGNRMFIIDNRRFIERLLGVRKGIGTGPGVVVALVIAVDVAF
jgi:hypothetical protein